MITALPWLRGCQR